MSAAQTKTVISTAVAPSCATAGAAGCDDTRKKKSDGEQRGEQEPKRRHGRPCAMTRPRVGRDGHDVVDQGKPVSSDDQKDFRQWFHGMAIGSARGVSASCRNLGLDEPGKVMTLSIRRPAAAGPHFDIRQVYR